MLHINRVIVKNFRPYYGVVTFDFGQADGISIVFGNNGIGKSSLIRAIRFVLYDEFDSSGDFQIKNELNIVAWEEQNYEMYVALDFKYNDAQYQLKRTRRPKGTVHGIPQSDNDFEGNPTLVKNGVMLPLDETNRILSNIIPKTISEYILFEGETIRKYKDLLDNNKNVEIYESIRKILGITTLENSRNDLEKQRGIYNEERVKILREQAKNVTLINALSRLTEEQKQFESDRKQAIDDLKTTTEQKEKYETILNNNQRISDLLANRSAQKEKLKGIGNNIEEEKEKIKGSLKQYKSFCYDLIKEETSIIPDSISETKKAQEDNHLAEKEKAILYNLLGLPNCTYCGHEMHDDEFGKIEAKIQEIDRKMIVITQEASQEVLEFDQKMDNLSKMLEGLSKGVFEIQIQQAETQIQTKLIEKDGIENQIKGIESQIETLGGTNDLDQVAKSFSIAEANERLHRKTIEDCEKSLKQIQSSIDEIAKKSPRNIDTEEIDSKIQTTTTLIDIFSRSIDAFSENMRKNVQEDATLMFKKISENQEYDKLEFDEQYGLKLIDHEGRIVPNVSSGYMTLITISLIYGLHKNSSLTGTIILDAPFSVLTHFHRDKIIEAFQTLSPQVILFVYRDQIDLEEVRRNMHGRLINEHEIYQDRTEINSSYKTRRRQVENNNG